MWMPGRAVRAEGIASAKAVRQGFAWRVQVDVRKPAWLEHSELGETRRNEDQEGRAEASDHVSSKRLLEKLRLFLSEVPCRVLSSGMM